MQRYPSIAQLYPQLLTSLNVLRQQNNELCICLYIKNSRVITDTKFTSLQLNKLVINPRVLLKKILNTNASELIVLHNHPSKSCYPSHADIISTEKITYLGLLLQFVLIDHIIVTTDEYFSFREAGMIDELPNQKF